MSRDNRRSGLGAHADERLRFRGFFVRYGQKRAFRGPPLATLLFRDVCLAENGQQMTDHLWFNETKGFKALGPLKEGDCIEFDARVTHYMKGYRGRREDIYKPTYKDWRLSFPTKIARNSQWPEGPQLPEKR